MLPQYHIHTYIVNNICIHNTTGKYLFNSKLDLLVNGVGLLFPLQCERVLVRVSSFTLPIHSTKFRSIQMQLSKLINESIQFNFANNCGACVWVLNIRTYATNSIYTANRTMPKAIRMQFWTRSAPALPLYLSFSPFPLFTLFSSPFLHPMLMNIGLVISTSKKRWFS